MSQTNDDKGPADADPDKSTREDMAEVDEKLDDRADGDGLAAEAGRGEETGLAEG